MHNEFEIPLGPSGEDVKESRKCEEETSMGHGSGINGQQLSGREWLHGRVS